MEQEKQIKEMESIIFESSPVPSVWRSDAHKMAEALYNAGYRKEQEVASTVIKFLINKKHELQKDNDLINASVEFYDFIDNFIGLTGEEILAELEKEHIDVWHKLSNPYTHRRNF